MNSSQVGRANGVNERARSPPCSRARPRETAADPATAAAVGSATAAAGRLSDSGGRRLGRQRRRWARATSVAVGSATDPAMRRIAATDPEAGNLAAGRPCVVALLHPPDRDGGRARPPLHRPLPLPLPTRTSPPPSSSPSCGCSARRPTPSPPALGWVIPSVVVALLRPLVCDADAVISEVHVTHIPD
uniref:Uncharacterized protein n=1 Tax=Oryza glumipatula TaxID=40148 RepID=A0A0E0BIY5_9ORYZ